MKFSKKIVVGILLIQIISSLIYNYLYHYQYATVLNMTIEKKECDTNFVVGNIFNELKQEYSKHAEELLLEQKIVEAFAKGNREELYKETLPIYEALKKSNKYLNIMNFYTADTHAFLRLNKPQEFGGTLGTFRKMVAKTNESKKPQYGMEAGKYGLYYRVMFPVFNGDEHIGAFEFGIDIKYLISRLSILNINTPALLVSKKVVAPIYMYDENASSYLSEFTNEYSIIKYNPQGKEDVSIVDIVDKNIIEKNSYIVDKNSNSYLLYRGYTLQDYKNSKIGYFVFMDKMNYYMETIVFVRWISIFTTLLLILVITLLMYKLVREYAAEIMVQKDILNYRTHFDSLTGLPNRVLFNDRLQQAIEKAKRQDKSLALLFIDLDRFKQINDSLGHDIGDKVLKIISERLKNVMRKEDSISRLGGDEFTILVQDLKKGEDASILAQKIISSLSKSINIEGHTLYVTSSIGISIFPNDGKEADNLLKNADAAMFRAKQEGRNNFQYYSSDMTELAFERVVMEASIRKALDNKEFVVYYQPQVDGITGKIVGMEALVRWQHPSAGMVFPDKFIPLAQETGLILAIDHLVMKSAMTQIAKWYKMGLEPGVLALNLSMKQLNQDGCLEKLSLLIKESNCRPEWIRLEITEGEIMKNPQGAIDVLNRISQTGIELAVDDFGTGYSSLSYLKRLPIDKLKIDKSFIDGLPSDEEDISIARAIIALAYSLKLDVIAEGVETKEQKEFLVKNGCINIQGYYYSMAVSSQEMEEMLKNGIKK